MLPPSLASLAFFAAVSTTRAQHEDSEIELAWADLEQSERVEVAEWFRLELKGLGTLVGRLVEDVSRRADIDPWFWPDAGPAPFFDPGGARRRLEPDSERVANLRAKVGGAAPELWSYDFATRRLIRSGDPKDPDRVLRDALAGRHPDLVYALATVERMLDDGRLQETFSALAHAYSEPDGAVHPDVTLYDVLAADEPLLLGDVDAVGIVRWIQGEETPWKAPVEADRRPELDLAIRALFQEARSWRATVRGVARAFLVGNEHGGLVDDPLLLQALWLSADSDPARLARRLPGPDRRERFFAEWAETVRLQKLRTNATYRQRALAADGARMRALFDDILVRFGAYEPRPPPKPPEPEATVAVPAAPVLEVDAAGEAALFERVAKLDRRRRDTLLSRCVAAARASGAMQVELVRKWIEEAGVAVEQLEPPTDFGAHDAKVYGGGSPRRLAEPSDRIWERLVDKIEFEPPPPWPRRVQYEFASGKLVALPPPPKAKKGQDELSELRLLLRGILPDQDLALAAVQKSLDRLASLRREAEFFAHLYCDREANAYAGITLGDAWSSDFEFEVPDVDALAYIDKLWHDGSVKPPLSQADHDRWYPRMGDSLRKLRTRVHVIDALAAVWFEGRPELPHGYDASIDILHAVIAGAGESTQELADRLERDRSDFVQNALRDVSHGGHAAWNAGNARRDELLRGARLIRGAVLDVLAAEGHLGT